MIIGRIFSFLFLISCPLSGEVGDVFIESSRPSEIQRKALLKLNETCIHKVDSQSYIVPKGLMVKDDELVFTGTREPSKAVKSFVRKQTNKERWVINENMAMEIANAFYVLKVLGDSLFDFHALNMAFQRELKWSVPVEAYIYSQASILSAERENNEGCIINDPWYGTMFSDSGSTYRVVNVITCGLNEKKEMIYFGFGPIFKEGPKTKHEIYEEFAIHLCSDPIPEGPAKKFNTSLQKVYQTSFEDGKEDFFKKLDKIQVSCVSSTVCREVNVSMELREKLRRDKESFETRAKQLEECLMSTNGDSHD